MQSLGCVVQHCAPEAHYLIGSVERRNAILAILLEEVIDFGQIQRCWPHLHKMPSWRNNMQESNRNSCVAKLCEQSHLRRALLRKTRNIKAPDLQPGQKVAMWRWTKRGQKKRGAWVITLHP